MAATDNISDNRDADSAAEEHGKGNGNTRGHKYKEQAKEYNAYDDR